MEGSIVDKDAQANQASSKIAELEAMLADAKSAMEAASGDAVATQSDLSSQIDGLTGQLDSLNGDKAALESQLAELQGRLSDLEGQLGSANSMVSQKDSDLANAQGAADDLEARIAGLQDEIALLQDRLSGAEKNADEQGAVAQNLANRLASIQQREESDKDSANALKEQIEQSLAANGVTDAAVSMRSDNSVVVNLRSEALFGSGRARLSQGGQGLMRQVASSIGNLGSSVQVEGHTDGIPVSGNLLAIFPSNWELSVARAANTVNYLQNTAGLDAERLSAVGFGENRPVASNSTREGRALNRRVEIVVKP